VRNVTTIVGLRAYSSKSNVLPEQTLGRGLRKMYPGDTEEFVSVVGTDAFMEFVESIQLEGVTLERKAMGEGSSPFAPLVIEVDEDNDGKDLDELDIAIPVLTPRRYREYGRLGDLDVDGLPSPGLPYRHFTEEEQREIIFKDITTGQTTHTTILDTAGVADFRSVIGYFAKTLMKDLRLVSGYDVLYPKLKEYIQRRLFEQPVDLESPNTLRNLSELSATKAVMEVFTKAINDLTVQDKGDAEVRDWIKLSNTRPFIAKDQGYLVSKKSVFNKIIGDNKLELDMATFLENCGEEEVVSYAKNYLAVGFRLDYVKTDGDLSNYYPDFFAKLADGRVFIIETKGREDVDVAPKMRRLREWCEDVNRVQSDVRFDFIYVDEESFKKHRPKKLQDLEEGFRQFKD
jgi:type III restriction enzyme